MFVRRNVSVFCREEGGEDCSNCLSLATSHNCGWCTKIKVCTTNSQCQDEWFTGPVKQCFLPEETVWTWLIVLSIFACVILTLILVASIIALGKIIKQFRSSRRKSDAKSLGIATLQKRMFGNRVEKPTEDPLPVVLLSYKADYDELLPIQVAPSSSQQSSNKRRDSLYYAIIDKKVSTPSSSFQGTMILNHQLSCGNTMNHYLRKHPTVPQINRLSLLWTNDSDPSTLDYSDSNSIYSPLPLPMPRLFTEDENDRKSQAAAAAAATAGMQPVSCQTSLMQMSSNQYYLVVQINLNEPQSSFTSRHLPSSNTAVYENYPQQRKFEQ